MNHLPPQKLPAHLVPAFRKLRVAFIEDGEWICNTIRSTLWQNPAERSECEKFIRIALEGHCFLTRYVEERNPDLVLSSVKARKQLRIDWLNQLLEPYDGQI